MFNLVCKNYFIIIFTTLFSSLLVGQSEMAENSLVRELGCGNCHSGLASSSLLKNVAPDLSYSGLKYNQSYLFDYLKNPHKVRHNIGNARMPNFNLADNEALAITKYLMSRKLLPNGNKLKPRKIKNSKKGFDLINDEYQCTACHLLNNNGKLLSIDLTNTGSRLQKNWIYEIILNPADYVPRGSPMPTYFNMNDPGADKIIKIMVGYLVGNAKNDLKKLQKKLNQASSILPDISVEMGKNIFLSQNCQSCHKMNGEENWFTAHNAPNLNAQKMRTKKEWLISYLKLPTPLRPNGYFPGTGSRMPNYDLTESEINNISSWLGESKLKTKLEPLSKFQTIKVEKLLNDYLPCLGCHELNGKGGRVGPSLSNSGERLTDGYIKMAIEMPHMVMPESIMPKVAMDKKWLPLIESYLADQKSSQLIKYENLISSQPYKINNDYEANCASCHGLKGNGQGFNATYLPISPGNFTNKDLVETQSDDALYNTISGGGRIMNKSHFMPGWGEKLSHQEIIKQVSIVRSFCNCEGPKWAED